MIEYRITAPIIDQEQLEQIMSAYFPGFAVYNQTVFWQGRIRKEQVICVIANRRDRYIIERIAIAIREYHGQKSIMLTENRIKVKFI